MERDAAPPTSDVQRRRSGVTAADLTRPVRVVIGDGQEVELRTLTTGDLEFMEAALGLGLPVRDFAVKVAHHQLTGGRRDEAEVREWPDEVLVAVLREWTASRSGLHEPLPVSGDPFASFGDAVRHVLDRHRGTLASHRAYVAEAERVQSETAAMVERALGRRMDAILREAQKVAAQAVVPPGVLSAAALTVSMPQETLAETARLAREASTTVTRALESQLMESARRAAEVMQEQQRAWFAHSQALTDQIAEITNAAHAQLLRAAEQQIRVLDWRALVPNLPDIRQLIGEWEEIQKGGQALDEAGFGFSRTILGAGFLASLARISPVALDAAATNRLLTLTRGPEFSADLERCVTGASVARRRWPILRAALGAHRRREYVLSVPALLSQAEGLVADTLVLRNEVVVQNGKVLALGPTGGLLLDKNGKPIERRGMGQLVQHSRLREHPLLTTVAQFIATTLAGERNAVLHGRSTSYGTAKFSVQALLVVQLFASALQEFEWDE